MAPKKNNSSVPSKIVAKRAGFSRLAKLVERRDVAGAQAVIDALMKKRLTQAEKAQIHMSMLSTYLEVSNDLNKHYLAELEDVAAFMKELKKEEKAVGEELALAKTRAKLV